MEITYKTACERLNLDGDFSIKDVRKNYLLLALKYHPDKTNNSDDSAVIFKNIKDAYDYLICYYEKLDNYESDFLADEEREETKEMESDISYIDLISRFISITSSYNNNIEITILLECFTNNCTKFSLKLLENLGIDNLIKLSEYITDVDSEVSMRYSIILYITYIYLIFKHFVHYI